MLQGVVLVILSLIPCSRTEASDERPARASAEATAVFQGLHDSPGGLAWRVRVGEAGISVDGFAAGPDDALNWRWSCSAWAYLAGPEDPTPQGFTRYRVAGIGAGHDVTRVRAGGLVILFSVSEPLNSPD